MFLSRLMRCVSKVNTNAKRKINKLLMFGQTNFTLYIQAGRLLHAGRRQVGPVLRVGEVMLVLEQMESEVGYGGAHKRNSSTGAGYFQCAPLLRLEAGSRRGRSSSRLTGPTGH